MGCNNETMCSGQQIEVSYDVMMKRERSMMKTFNNIMNHVHDGVIIKSADRQEIFMTNETANTIMRVDEHQVGMQYWMLNTKRFTKIDLSEEKTPLLDDKSQIVTMADTRKKVSLNTIVKQLENHGDHGFSESTIYKVSIPKSAMDIYKRNGQKPITHIMVEATMNVFEDETAVTIYLRNVSYLVEVQKFYQKAM